MYNTHPTIIDHNSRFYNESAKLAYIFNDISAKQESMITQSAPEQVIWAWEIASEGARWEFGLLSNMPMPEAYEPRVGLAVHLSICNQGCEPEGVFIDLIIQLKNAPSSEPDAGERHVPYAVFKPIKDGINRWVRNVQNSGLNILNGYDQSNNIDSNSIDDFVDIATGGSFVTVLEVIISVIKAALLIASPFFSLVGWLASSLVKFLTPIIINAICSGGKKGKDYNSWDGFLDFITPHINNDDSKSEENDDQGIRWAVVLLIMDLIIAKLFKNPYHIVIVLGILSIINALTSYSLAEDGKGPIAGLCALFSCVLAYYSTKNAYKTGLPDLNEAARGVYATVTATIILIAWGLSIRSVLKAAGLPSY